MNSKVKIYIHTRFFVSKTNIELTRLNIAVTICIKHKIANWNTKNTVYVCIGISKPFK